MGKKILLKRLLPYTTYLRSNIRRGGIIGALKNCCFDFGNSNNKIESLFLY